jgi:hypothetical protein
MHLRFCPARLSPRRVGSEESSGVMKKNTLRKKTGSRNPSKITELPCKHNKQNLDDLAAELDCLARKSLRDGLLQGVLSGQEHEIRNDAVLLALQWYVRGGNPAVPTNIEKLVPTWHAPRALAHALKIVKMRLARSLTKGALNTVPIDEANGGSTPHPSDLTPREWPEAITREVICRGIHLAAKCGRISHANACIARLVFLDDMPISQVAMHRGVHRSAVSQQIWRVMRVLPEVLETVEVPSMK